MQFSVEEPAAIWAGPINWCPSVPARSYLNQRRGTGSPQLPDDVVRSGGRTWAPIDWACPDCDRLFDREFHFTPSKIGIFLGLVISHYDEANIVIGD